MGIKLLREEIREAYIVIGLVSQHAKMRTPPVVSQLRRGKEEPEILRTSSGRSAHSEPLRPADARRSAVMQQDENNFFDRAQV